MAEMLACGGRMDFETSWASFSSSREISLGWGTGVEVIPDSDVIFVLVFEVVADGGAV